jgi:hypothetical protein
MPCFDRIDALCRLLTDPARVGRSGQEPMMFKDLLGRGWLTGGGAGRVLASYMDRSGAWSGGDEGSPITDGLVAGTLVATATGWQPVEDLRAGDMIVTFDAGMQPLRRITRATLGTRPGDLPRIARPLSLPKGALGNRREMVLLPGQPILIETDRAEELYGDPFTLIPAVALAGHRGIATAVPQDEIEVWFLEFETDQIVYVEGTVLAHCPCRQPRLVQTADDLIGTGHEHGYPLLPPQQGRALVAELA